MEVKHKKKIAIYTQELLIGGAEIALVNLLNSIDLTKYDVTIFTDHKKDNLHIDKIPSGVRFIYIEDIISSNRNVLKKDIKNFRIFRVFKGGVYRILSICNENVESKIYYGFKSLQVKKETFDISINFLIFNSFAPYSAFVDGKLKVLFIHGMVDLPILENKYTYKKGKCFDKIFCVSKLLKDEVDKRYPALAKKTEVFYNIIPENEIREKAEEAFDIDFDANTINIVTVGRLSPQKGQDMVPKTVRLLLDAGYDIKWYLVGDGDFRETVEAEIKNYDVDDNVILLGTKSNPYPYIKNCDIYVQPSYSEGYCTTTMEAKILGKPIVTTDAPGMREQFVSGENGLIVDAMTPEALFEGIKTLIDSPELREKFVENLSHEKCDNSSELEKIYSLIED